MKFSVHTGSYSFINEFIYKMGILLDNSMEIIFKCQLVLHFI